MDENVPRWFLASISKHFDARRKGITMYVEGDNRSVDTNDQIELRVDGPDYRTSNNTEEYTTHINVLVSTLRDQTDAHKQQKRNGIVGAAFTSVIPVYKYGNNAVDDQSLFGCLEIVDEFKITLYSAVDGKPNLMFSSVEAVYILRRTK